MSIYDELQLDSLHEAGHAVAIAALGGVVEYVTLDTCVQAEESALKPWDAAVTCMAGGVAARMIGPGYRSLSREASEQDRAVCESHLAKIGKGPEDIPQVERAARDLLLDHKRAVIRVSHALRATGSLMGHQVVRLFLGEGVDDVVARPVTPPPTLNHDGSVRVEACAFECGGRWVASVFYPLQEELRDVRVLDGEGVTAEEALDVLGGHLHERLGVPVCLDVLSVEGAD